jgi:hypothetical protein
VSQADLLPHWSKKLSPNFPFVIINDEGRLGLRRRVAVVTETPGRRSLRGGLTSSRGVDNGIPGWVPGCRIWEWDRYRKIIEQNFVYFPGGSTGN